MSECVYVTVLLYIVEHIQHTYTIMKVAAIKNNNKSTEGKEVFTFVLFLKILWHHLTRYFIRNILFDAPRVSFNQLASLKS